MHNHDPALRHGVTPRRVLAAALLGNLRLAAAALLFACTAQPAPPAPPAPADGDGWSLTLETQEGYRSDAIHWGVTIGSEGLCRAWWQRWRGVHQGEPFDPSPQMRARLRQAVGAAGLTAMPECLAASSDADWMTLVFVDSAGEHRVRVADALHLAGQPSPDDILRRDAIRRFLHVAAEVLRLQPSPCTWQTPEALDAWAGG